MAGGVVLRLLDVIDGRKTQVESLRKQLRAASPEGAAWAVADAGRLGSGDLSRTALLIAPQDTWIQHIRDGRAGWRKRLTDLPILMLDMKGPSGIDTAVMLRAAGLDLRYISPHVGEPRHAAAFEYLARHRIPVWPLPYFPSYRFDPTHLAPAGVERADGLGFAGNVYGYRRGVLGRLTEGLGRDRVHLVNRLSPADYLDFYRRHTLGIDIRGTDAATYRFHELCLSGGCFLIDNRSLALFGALPDAAAEHLLYDSPEVALSRAGRLLGDTALAGALGDALAAWYAVAHGPDKYLHYLQHIATAAGLRPRVPNLRQNGPFVVEPP